MHPTRSQCKHLGGIGHNLKPIIFIGDKGLTESVYRDLDNALEHHEILKIRIRVDNRKKRDELLEKIVERSMATLLQKIGNIALLYRQSKDQKLELPK